MNFGLRVGLLRDLGVVAVRFKDVPWLEVYHKLQPQPTTNSQRQLPPNTPHCHRQNDDSQHPLPPRPPPPTTATRNSDETKTP